MGSAKGSGRASAGEGAVSVASDSSALARTRSSASRLDVPEGVEIRSSDAPRRDAGRVEEIAHPRNADARLAFGEHARAGDEAGTASVIPRETVRCWAREPRLFVVAVLCQKICDVN